MITTPQCQFCGRPVLGFVVYGNDGEPYHGACAASPSGQTSGCEPPQALTEEKVRTIVRDELKKLTANAAVHPGRKLQLTQR
jgi:hypothetical protein